ncbi:hypothetical protein [Nocardioides sp. HB32]
MTTADGSASYAADVARLLWPPPWAAPCVTRGRTGDAADRNAYLFPSSRRPRLLVPVDVPGSARMLDRLGPDSLVSRPVRGALERSVRSGVLGLTPWPVLRVSATDPDADSIERHLSACLGTAVRVGVMLGTRRANQKPVLPVFEVHGGRLLAYAKVGHNELTRRLVDQEARALLRLADHELRHFRVPAVLHHGPWAGLQVLAVSPLASDRDRVVTAGARTAATWELSHLGGVSCAPLTESTFWRRLHEAISALPARPDRDHLGAAAHAVAADHGTDRVRLGGWHGDWGHWNMGMSGSVVDVWDWERYEPDVPLGFDGLHFAAQLVRPGERDQRRQEQQFFASVPELLVDLGIPTADHELTLRLYLLHIGVRYADALRHGSTPALVRRTAWVLAQLDRLGETARPVSTKGIS